MQRHVAPHRSTLSAIRKRARGKLYLPRLRESGNPTCNYHLRATASPTFVHSFFFLPSKEHARKYIGRGERGNYGDYSVRKAVLESEHVSFCRRLYYVPFFFSFFRYKQFPVYLKIYYYSIRDRIRRGENFKRFVLVATRKNKSA